MVLGSALAVAVALPWWLGPAAAWVGRSRGVTFGAYERIGYARFALHQVDYRRGNVHVTVSRVEGETPALWLWHRAQGRPAEVVADQWVVEVAPGTKSPPVAVSSSPSAGSGWVPLRALLLRIAGGLDRWLPRAKVGAGAVRWPNGGLALRSATWAGRALVVENLVFGPLNAHATVTFPSAGDAIGLKVRTTDGAGDLTLESHGSVASGVVTWWEQRANVNASFAERGWLPQVGALQSDAWSVPGTRLKLGELYALVRGHGKVDWREGRLLADLTATGEPVPGRKSVPPLDVTVRGHGDIQTFTVDALHAALPGLVAQLSEPITVDRQGKFSAGAAQFTLALDLAKQPWFSAAGTAQGEARLVSGVAQAPVVEFHASAKGIAAHEVAIASVEATGRFAWPRVEISSATVVGGAGETLRGHGGWDIHSKEILDAEVEGSLRRASLARWLPAQPAFDAIAVKAHAAGPLTALRHDGHAAAQGVVFHGVSPLALTLDWRGQNAAIAAFSVLARAGATEVSAGGAVEAGALRLTALKLAQAGAVRLSLQDPATLRWQPALQVESLHLAGPDGVVDAALLWGETGRADLTLRGISSDWLADFVALPGPPWRVGSLALTGAWDRGPMVYSTTGDAEIDLGTGRSARITLAARGDHEGLRVEALSAMEGAEKIVNLTGHAPMTVTPGAANWLVIDENAPLAINVTAAPNATFWQKLAALSGVELQAPQATAQITGTWAQPLGEVRLKAARVELDAARIKGSWPTIEELDAAVVADAGGLRLDGLTVKIEGQPVRASGRLPVPKGGWGEAFKQPLAFVRRGAEVHLDVPDAAVAGFARLLPTVLAPQGRIVLKVDYKNDSLDGLLRLRDAATRPLGPLGVLQEISADVRMTGRKLELTEVTAKAGGQPVTLTGTIELPADAPPRYALALRGENLPFARQTGLLVRGDVDLKLQTPADGPSRIGGTVRLRNSLFLSDVRAFIDRSGGTSAARRPPYFAVEAAPFNTWVLGVDVSGDRFLRLRTPVFNGVASARFRLGGTLGEPRAIGEVTIDEGQVLMPFASFEVKQGVVRLTEGNPYEPAVFLRGTGRRYGYDLTLELDGTAAQPNATFSSSPAIDSQQLLLMVMTGVAPSNEITFSVTQRATRIGAYLGQSLLSNFGGDPGKADRLSITSGEKVSLQGKETYDIEYKLADRWTLVGEYDEFDDYNAGFKWRLFPRERKPTTSVQSHEDK